MVCSDLSVIIEGGDYQRNRWYEDFVGRRLFVIWRTIDYEQMDRNGPPGA